MGIGSAFRKASNAASDVARKVAAAIALDVNTAKAYAVQRARMVKNVATTAGHEVKDAAIGVKDAFVSTVKKMGGTDTASSDIAHEVSGPAVNDAYTQVHAAFGGQSVGQSIQPCPQEPGEKSERMKCQEDFIGPAMEKQDWKGEPLSYSDPDGLRAGMNDCPPICPSLNDPANIRRVAELNPKIQAEVKMLLLSADRNGMHLRITQGYRSMEEQDKLYEKGRTKPGKIVTNARGGESYHNYGLAIDVVEMKDGLPDWNGDWEKIGNLGKAAGFEWGGDWKSFLDRPHFEKTDGLTIKDLQRGYGQNQ